MRVRAYGQAHGKDSLVALNGAQEHHMYAAGNYYFVENGPSLMQLMLAHYEREDGARAILFGGRFTDEEGSSLGNFKIAIEVTGSDLIMPGGEYEGLGPTPSGWTIRGLTAIGDHMVEGWYNPDQGVGVLSIGDE